MFSKVIKLAQFAYIIWPLLVVTAFTYSFLSLSGRNWLHVLGRRIYKNLSYTWTVLFLIWVITLFADEAIPSLLPEPENSILFFSGIGMLAIIGLTKTRIFPICVQARLDMHAAQAIKDLNRMDPNSFEELVAETFRMLGYQAQRTGRTGDHGIDIELQTNKGERWIVQCKRYRNSVGEGIVRELYGTLVNEKANRAVLVTSSEITPPAETWARGKPISLIDGRQLLKLVEHARHKSAGSFLEQFISWLEMIIRHLQTPPALRQVARTKPRIDSVFIGNSVAETRPNPTNHPSAPIKTQTIPICPRCGIRMIQHPEHPGRRLYRCRNYPSCKVVLEG